MVSQAELILRVIILWFLVLAQFLETEWVPLMSLPEKTCRKSQPTKISVSDPASVEIANGNCQVISVLSFFLSIFTHEF